MNDLISREEAIRRYCREHCGWEPEKCPLKFEQDGTEECSVVRFLKELPSAEPESSEITDEQAILHLQSTGWLQNHDLEMCGMWLKEQMDEKGRKTMCDISREMTREELVAFNNELRAENEKLKAELQEARLAVEHNRHVAEDNQLKCELRYRDGIIYGMKYALKCNGISGGEMEERYE